MGGHYEFMVPNLKDNYDDSGNQFHHRRPYRSTGVQRVEWLALKVRKMLVRQKIKFKWKELIYGDLEHKIIEITWKTNQKA